MKGENVDHVFWMGDFNFRIDLNYQNFQEFYISRDFHVIFLHFNLRLYFQTIN